jgi:hypothetical protein
MAAIKLLMLLGYPILTTVVTQAFAARLSIGPASCIPSSLILAPKA